MKDYHFCIFIFLLVDASAFSIVLSTQDDANEMVAKLILDTNSAGILVFDTGTTVSGVDLETKDGKLTMQSGKNLTVTIVPIKDGYNLTTSFKFEITANFNATRRTLFRVENEDGRVKIDGITELVLNVTVKMNPNNATIRWDLGELLLGPVNLNMVGNETKNFMFGIEVMSIAAQGFRQVAKEAMVKAFKAQIPITFSSEGKVKKSEKRN